MSATSTGLGHFADLVGTTMARAIEMTSTVAPIYGAGLPSAGFDRTMGIAARLFNAGIGVRVISVELGSFDTHNGQPYNHQNLLTALDAGIEEFFVQLAPALRERTAVATFSEFGRRLQRNASAGTDHGSASVALVVGSSVRGGVHGSYPSLTQLDSRGNLRSTVDFRSYYASLVDHWLGGASRDVLGGAFAPLGLFTTSGAAPQPSIPAIAAAASVDALTAVSTTAASAMTSTTAAPTSTTTNAPPPTTSTTTTPAATTTTTAPAATTSTTTPRP